MDPAKTPFTAIYAQWLHMVGLLLPGGARPSSPLEPTPQQEQAAAHEGWEDEGGSVTPAAMHPQPERAPKLPL